MRKTYRLRLEVLSAVYIGSGQSLSRINYILEEGRIRVFDHAAFFAKHPELLEAFERDLLEFYRSFHLKTWMKKNGVTEEEYASALIYDIDAPDLNRPETIFTFVRDGWGRPYIPGSSLKGALITALTTVALLKSTKRQEYRKTFKDLLRIDNPGQFRHRARSLNAAIMRDLWDTKIRVTGGDTRGRGASGILVSDSTPLDNTAVLRLSQKSDIDLDNQLQLLAAHRECLCPGMAVEFSLTLDTKLLPETMGLANLEDLFEKLGEQQKLLYGEEGVRRRQAYTADYLPSMPEAIADHPHGLLLLGGGAGFETKTVLAALAEDAAEAVALTWPMLSLLFGRMRHQHSAGDAISPRNLKLSASHLGGKLMGFCALHQV